MKIQIWILLMVFLGVFGMAMATEEASYKVIKHEGAFEIRDYDAHLLAETLVDGTFENAGNVAFHRLFKYISGENLRRETISMTAPVGQEMKGQKIAMTAPVGLRAEADQWGVSFMMPSSFTLETLPLPTDPTVTIRVIPARRMVAIRYGGVWSSDRYQRHLSMLEAWLKKNNLQTTGGPVWARYNPPFTPWFLRRNEILIPVKE